jgi:hypothetical protein
MKAEGLKEIYVVKKCSNMLDIRMNSCPYQIMLWIIEHEVFHDREIHCLFEIYYISISNRMDSLGAQIAFGLTTIKIYKVYYSIQSF